MFRFIFYLVSLPLFCILLGNDFNQGPYGENYFDFAGHFSLPDINSELVGDVNQDNVLNIQDIILCVNHILGNIPFNNLQIQYGDLTNDGIVNISDITDIIFKIVNDIGAQFDFRESWNGQDSYIFINYNTNVPNSTALWNSNTKADLLANSPDNVHYFFLSEGNNPEQNIIDIKSEFDDLILTMSLQEQEHWKTYLHFVPQRLSTINNWIANILADKHSFGIDRFQRIKQIGYLGNPNGFTGTFLSYLAHEAHYYNYEFNVLYEPNLEYDEIVVFEKTYYTGGWAASISELINFPTNETLNSYSGVSVELLRGCPDSNGNYSDQGCDDYDRKARLFIYDGICYERNEYSWLSDESLCTESGFEWNNDTCVSYVYYNNETIESCGQMGHLWDYEYGGNEITRWITPFDRQPHHLTDISQFLAHFRPGGTKLVRFQESGWPNSLLTLKFRFYRDSNGIINNPKEFIPMWNGTVLFNPQYNENRPPLNFEVPDIATKVEFVAYLTGHGWGNMTCSNCAEFCNSDHVFTLNGGVYEFNKNHPEALSTNHCQSIEMIQSGTIPNQYGTWGYGRAGWCPGMDVKPFVVDITQYVEFGSNILDYSACHVQGTNCVEPPECGTCGYCPEIPMSSYIIISY